MEAEAGVDASTCARLLEHRLPASVHVLRNVAGQQAGVARCLLLRADLNASLECYDGASILAPALVLRLASRRAPALHCRHPVRAGHGHARGEPVSVEMIDHVQRGIGRDAVAWHANASIEWLLRVGA